MFEIVAGIWSKKENEEIALDIRIEIGSVKLSANLF